MIFLWNFNCFLKILFCIELELSNTNIFKNVSTFRYSDERLLKIMIRYYRVQDSGGRRPFVAGGRLDSRHDDNYIIIWTTSWKRNEIYYTTETWKVVGLFDYIISYHIIIPFFCRPVENATRRTWQNHDDTIKYILRTYVTSDREFFFQITIQAYTSNFSTFSLLFFTLKQCSDLSR